MTIIIYVVSNKKFGILNDTCPNIQGLEEVRDMKSDMGIYKELLLNVTK